MATAHDMADAPASTIVVSATSGTGRDTTIPTTPQRCNR
jgi:hypothetical protein